MKPGFISICIYEWCIHIAYLLRCYQTPMETKPRHHVPNRTLIEGLAKLQSLRLKNQATSCKIHNRYKANRKGNTIRKSKHKRGKKAAREWCMYLAIGWYKTATVLIHHKFRLCWPIRMWSFVLPIFAILLGKRNQYPEIAVCQPVQ